MVRKSAATADAGGCACVGPCSFVEKLAEFGGGRAGGGGGGEGGAHGGAEFADFGEDGLDDVDAAFVEGAHSYGFP